MILNLGEIIKKTLILPVSFRLQHDFTFLREIKTSLLKGKKDWLDYGETQNDPMFLMWYLRPDDEWSSWNFLEGSRSP